MIKKSYVFNSRIMETEHAKIVLGKLKAGEFDGMELVESSEQEVMSISIEDGVPSVVLYTKPDVSVGSSVYVVPQMESRMVFVTPEEQIAFFLVYGRSSMFNDYRIVQEFSLCYYYDPLKLRPEGEFLKKMREFVGE